MQNTNNASNFATNLIEPGNKFTFTCPTVKRDTLFMACHFMKIKHWRGERIPCPDCATAMNGSKCPVVYMLREDADFFDSEPRHHSIPTKILNKIANILLFPFHANGLALTPDQSQNLFSNETIHSSGHTDIPGRKKRVKNLKLSNETVDTNDTLDGLSEISSDRSEQLNKALEI